MTVDVTQIRHYNRLIPRYSNYYYSVKLTLALGVWIEDYSLILLLLSANYYLLYHSDFIVNRGFG